MRVGLIGIPIEEIPVCDDDCWCAYHLSAYVPDVTKETRKLILGKAKEQRIEIEDLGEADVGEFYRPKFRADMLNGVHFFLTDEFKDRDMKKLEAARKSVLEKCKEYDVFIATGPSHLGAIVLYDEGDVVARLDYHDDFTDFEPSKVHYSYASYMDWVKANVKDVDVTNYFVKAMQNGAVFGRLADAGDRHYVSANHFDIDVDCFDPRFCVQRLYSHVNGPSPATPEMVLSMVNEAKPRKIGIWEYRPEHDAQGNGIGFILGAMKAAMPLEELSSLSAR